jgi:hypothetical protein
MVDIGREPSCEVTGLCEVDDEDFPMCEHCGGWRVKHPDTGNWVPEHYLDVAPKEPSE